MTEKNTTTALWANLKIITFVLLGLTFSSFAKLIDQTVATVGPHVVTYRDVKIQSLVAYMLQKESLPDESRPDLGPEVLLKAREMLITEYMIREYLQSIQLAAEVSPDALVKLEKTIEKIKPGDFLSKNKIAPSEITEALTHKLKIDRFYEDQLGFRVRLNDSEVKAHYEKHKNSKFLSKAFIDVENIVRADLKKEKLQQEFSQWMLMQSRRVDIQRLPMPA